MAESTIYVDESDLSNTLKLVEDQFECNIVSNHFFIKGDDVNVSSYFYTEFDGISMSINRAYFKENTRIISKQDSQGVVVIRFMYNNMWEIDNADDSKEIEHGIVFYRSNSAFSKVIKSNSQHKWITLRMTIDFYLKLSRGENKELADFICNESSWIMYETITPEIHHCMTELFLIDKVDTPGNRIKSISLGFRLLSLLAPRVTQRGLGSNNFGLLAVDSEIMLSIKENILKDITTSPDIDLLAKEYAISPSKLRSNFKRMYGMPIMKFLMQERFYKAYRLIEKTEDSIKSIAYDTGFANITHFSKGFKDLFGFAPSHLRK